MADKVCPTFGRQFSNKITGLQNAVRVYYVFLDSPRDNLSDVLADALAVGLPDVGDAYINDSTYGTLLLTSHDVNEIEKEKGFYSITCNYESNNLNFALPTQRPWNISFSSRQIEYVPEQTLFNSGTVFPSGQIKPVGINLPIFNTAGFPFDPPITDVKNQVVITLQKNFSNITSIGTITDINDLMDRINTVNDDVVAVAGVTPDYFQFLIEDIQCKYTESNGESYYDTTFTIVYDKEYHVQKILNAGFQDKNAKKITNKDGTDLQIPWPLDINGDALPKTLTPSQRSAQSIYLAFGVKRLSSIGDLALPTGF